MPRATCATNGPALLDAIRFPSDPAHAILEQNDLVLQFRSDRLEHIAEGVAR